MGYIVIWVIMGLAIPVLIIYGIVHVLMGRFSNRGDESKEEKDNFWHFKITGSSGFIIGLLIMVIFALGERILYDLARVFVGPNFDYVDSLATISLHAMFIIPIFAIAWIAFLVAL